MKVGDNYAPPSQAVLKMQDKLQKKYLSEEFSDEAIEKSKIDVMNQIDRRRHEPGRVFPGRDLIVSPESPAIRRTEQAVRRSLTA